MTPDIELIGWLVFFERTIGHIAWPAAIVTASVLFKRQIVQIMGRLRSIKHKETEVTFSEMLDEASAEASAIPISVDKSSIDADLLSNYPHLAISEAWRKIENQIGTIVATEWPRLPEREFHGLSAVRHFERLKLADPSLLRLIHDLRRLRNEAIHGEDGDVTVGQAHEYVSLASRVEAQLAEIETRVPKQ